MLKNILNLEGVQLLEKVKQKTIIGGRTYRCVCENSDARWEDTYYKVSKINDAIQEHCADGLGTCFRMDEEALL